MLAASWSIHQLPAQTNSGGASQETPASAAPRRPWCRQGPSRARACQGCRAPPQGEGRHEPPAASGPPRRRARHRHRRTGRRALLHLARRCGWRVAKWSRFPSRRLPEVLKASILASPMAFRDSGGGRRFEWSQMQQCRAPSAAERVRSWRRSPDSPKQQQSRAHLSRRARRKSGT